LRVLTEWWKWIATFVACAAALPLLQKAAEFIFTEGRKKWEGAVAARRVIATQFDPLLKAADYLYGKLRALADADFADFRRLPAKDLHRWDLVNLCSTLYLFGDDGIMFGAAPSSLIAAHRRIEYAHLGFQSTEVLRGN
jgi:hypothetical protein